MWGPWGGSTSNYANPSAVTSPTPGDDVIEGGAGADSIYGEDGADTIDGGADDDLIDGGSGDDSLIGGAGSDTLTGGAGADTIEGEAGDDDILFGADDSVYGGSGDDVFTLDVDNLDGNYTRIDGGSDGTDGSPDDAANGDDGDILDLSNALSGASITYMVDPELGNINGIDTDTGSDISFIDIEKIIATDHADSVDGQFATSGILLDMAAGDDSFAGGSGDDTVNAGSGDDTIDGADGDDSLTGGDGNDTFVFDESGDDTISDFGVGNSGSQDDGDQSNNDFIDLEDYYTDIFELRADFEDDGLLNQSVGDFSDNTAFTGSLTLTGLSKTDLTFDTTNVICFTRGTMIKTIEGDRAIEDLRQGDLVWTKDDGFQPIQWIGSKALDQATLEAAPKLRPVRIKAGAMGRGLPKRDLIVSPQHRVLVNSKIVQRMTNEDEVLVSAKHLLQINGVDYLDADGVEYFHFIFDKHQIVLAEGAESESLFTGPEALAAVEPEAREEILEIFPELASMDYDATITAVRPILSGRQSRKLTVRHVQNRKALLM